MKNISFGQHGSDYVNIQYKGYNLIAIYVNNFDKNYTLYLWNNFRPNNIDHDHENRPIIIGVDI